MRQLSHDSCSPMRPSFLPNIKKQYMQCSRSFSPVGVTNCIGLVASPPDAREMKQCDLSTLECRMFSWCVQRAQLIIAVNPFVELSRRKCSLTLAVLVVYAPVGDFRQWTASKRERKDANLRRLTAHTKEYGANMNSIKEDRQTDMMIWATTHR